MSQECTQTATSQPHERHSMAINKKGADTSCQRTGQSGTTRWQTGVTLLPWAIKGKALAWDITVPDTYAESHLQDTACRPGAAADKAAANKSSKYCDLAGTHLFFPVAIETAGTWNQMAVELVQEIGRRITLVTEDSRETAFLFQCLSIALQRGNAVSFLSKFTATD